MDKSIFIRYCKKGVKLHIAPQTRFGAGGGRGAEGGVRGGCSLIWPQRECAAAQGMIFRVSGLKQGIQFFYLMAWNECLFGPKAFKRVGRLAMSSPSYLAQWERAAAQGVIFSPGIQFHFMTSWNGWVFLHREWSKRLAMSGLHVWYHQFSQKILIHDVSLKCFL